MPKHAFRLSHGLARPSRAWIVVAHVSIAVLAVLFLPAYRENWHLTLTLFAVIALSAWVRSR